MSSNESFFSVVFYSFYVLNGNYMEFEKTIEEYLKATVGDEFMFNRERQINLSINAGREIGRRIHNYSAAWYSLVDHSRRIAKKLSESKSPGYQELSDEYRIKVRDYFGDSFENQFIGDLRRYVQHKRIPVPTLHFKAERIWDASPQAEGVLCNMSHSFDLNSREIKDFDWKPKSKKYIDENQSIPVAEILNRHFESMKAFYQWVEYKDSQIRPFSPKEIQEATFEDWQKMNKNRFIT